MNYPRLANQKMEIYIDAFTRHWLLYHAASWLYIVT